MSRRRDRFLDERERALWDLVVRTVTPLETRPARLPEQTAGATSAPAESGSTSTLLQAEVMPATIVSSPTIRSVKPDHPPLAPLKRRERRSIRRGQTSIDAILDLHGYRQNEAHQRLRAFLIEAVARGYRTVLVVTGKGSRNTSGSDLHLPSSSEGGREYGALRRLAPLVLESPEMRRVVLGFELADQRHGGAGAIYVRLRAPKRQP